MKTNKKKNLETKTFFTLLDEINDIEKSDELQKNTLLIKQAIIKYHKIKSKIIESANSSEYTFFQSIKSLDNAYYLIGIEEIKNIIIHEIVCDIFCNISLTDSNSHEITRLIQKSLFNSMLINEIVKKLNIGNNKKLKLFGLVYHIDNIVNLYQKKYTLKKNLGFIRKFKASTLLNSLFDATKNNIYKNDEEAVVLTSLKISEHLFDYEDINLNKLIQYDLPLNFGKNDLMDILEKIKLDTFMLISDFSQYHKDIRDRIQKGIKSLDKNITNDNNNYQNKKGGISEDITYITKYLNYVTSPIEALQFIENYFEYNKKEEKIIFFEETNNNLLNALFKENHTINKKEIEESKQTNILIPFNLKNKLFYLYIKNNNEEKIIGYLNILIEVIKSSFKKNICLHTLRNQILDISFYNPNYIKNRDRDNNNINLCRNLIFSDISSLVFHRLKNKLTPILGYTQMLEKKITSQKDQEKLEKIKKNSYQLSEILTTFRQYMVQKLTYVPINTKELNLNQLIIDALNQFKKNYAEMEALITIKLDKLIPLSLLNKEGIILAVSELLDNSYNAILSKKNKKIKIETFQKDKTIGLTILDNGTGIEDIEKALTPFYSEKNSTGLGLSLCKIITDKHEGTLSLESKSGEYTSVSITLPIKKMDSLESIQNKNILNNENILIVSETEWLEKTLMENFEGFLGITPLTINSYKEALNTISKQNKEFLLIISDIIPDVEKESFLNLTEKDSIILILDKHEINQIEEIKTKHNIKPLYKPIRLIKLRKIVSDKLINIRRKNG